MCIKLFTKIGWMENEECGVRSAENKECVENEEYGKWSVWKCINFDSFINFKAF